MATKRDKRGRFLGAPVQTHSTRRVNIKPESLRTALVGEAERARKALPKASMAAARRFVRHLADQTDEMGITDRGILKNSWRAERDGKGAMVFSDAPHAGIIEMGARPHPVPDWVRALIAQWAERKLGLRPSEAARAAEAIGDKIERVGQAPKYLVRDNMPYARRYFAEEFARVMRTEPRPRVAR